MEIGQNWEIKKQVMQKVEMVAGWDFMHGHKHGLHGSGILQQWQGNH